MARTKIDMIDLIGRMDRLLSETMIASKNLDSLDEADRHTLKHHAEDMKGAAEKVLERITAFNAHPPDDV